MFGDDEEYSLYSALTCLYGSYSQCEIEGYDTTLPECHYYDDEPTYGTCEEIETYYEKDDFYHT